MRWYMLCDCYWFYDGRAPLKYPFQFVAGCILDPPRSKPLYSLMNNIMNELIFGAAMSDDFDWTKNFHSPNGEFNSLISAWAYYTSIMKTNHWARPLGNTLWSKWDNLTQEALVSQPWLYIEKASRQYLLAS